MKTLTLSFLLCMGFIASEAQKTRSLGDFKGIESSGNFNIVLTQSDQQSLSIETSEEIEPLIKTEVENGILHISFAKNKMHLENTPNINIGFKNLESLKASGITNIQTTNQVMADKIRLEISGIGNIEMNIKANTITTEQSGAGNIKLSGSANLLAADISGAGKLKAEDLKSDTVIAKISGAGEAKVNAVKSLEADVSGAGSINYTGNPEIKKVKVSGVGSIHPSSASVNDTTVIRLNKKRILIIGDEDEENNDSKNKVDENEDEGPVNIHESFHHWTGIGFGVNGYLTPDNKLTLPAANDFLELNYNKSLNFTLNFAEKDIHIYKNYLNLVTGLGLEFNSYTFRNNISLDPNSSYVTASWDTLIDYKKNKLKSCFINLPILLEMNTSSNPDKAFHLAAGLILGYKLGSKTKQEYDLNKREVEVKVKDDFNLTPFRSALTVRAGFSYISLFATYSLTTLFENKKGPALYPFSIGLAFNAD